MKRILVSLFAVLFLFFGTPTNSLADDITGISLEKELRAVIDLGIMRGYSDGVYKPYEIVNRASFAAFTARALDLPQGTGHFPDVDKYSKLANDIHRVSSAKLMNGHFNGNFAPYDPVTREQIVVVVSNALNYMGIEPAQAEVHFTDRNQVSRSISNETLSTVVSYGIVRGFPNGDGTFRFEPKRQATRAEAAAFISRMLDIIKEKKQTEQIDQADKPFAIATMGSDRQLHYETTQYASFDEAEKALTSPGTQFITNGPKILKMNQGMAYAKPASTSGAITRIYASNLSSILTYVPANAELKYLESTRDYVKVQISDQVGYVKHADIWLVPDVLVQGQSYYTVSNGELIHSIYNPATSTYSSYKYGKAPSFLKAGTRYHSLNGDTFYTEAGTLAGTGYQYFNVLSVRSKTSYTAEQLNSYIAKVKPESPLKELGHKFKEAEEKYRINALFLYATAIHESNYALSSKVTECKNMFGIGVYDSDPTKCKPFTSLEESIDYAAQMLSNNYVNPTGTFYNGAVAGDKAKGMNVRYASDPYWGQKIAGHMYRIDSLLGSQEFGKYQIGATTSDTLNVRQEPNTNLAALYSYRGQGFPLLLIEQVAGQAVSGNDKWWKIQADLGSTEHAYVHSNYVRVLPIAGK